MAETEATESLANGCATDSSKSVANKSIETTVDSDSRRAKEVSSGISSTEESLAVPGRPEIAIEEKEHVESKVVVVDSRDNSVDEKRVRLGISDARSSTVENEDDVIEVEPVPARTEGIGPSSLDQLGKENATRMEIIIEANVERRDLDESSQKSPRRSKVDFVKSNDATNSDVSTRGDRRNEEAGERSGDEMVSKVVGTKSVCREEEANVVKTSELANESRERAKETTTTTSDGDTSLVVVGGEVKPENAEKEASVASLSKDAEESTPRPLARNCSERSKTKSAVTSVKQASAVAAAARGEGDEGDREQQQQGEVVELEVVEVVEEEEEEEEEGEEEEEEENVENDEDERMLVLEDENADDEEQQARRTRVEGEGEGEPEDEIEDENGNNEQLEVGIVGPPTAVSELINEEELRTESVLPTARPGTSTDTVQDHVAEWVQNSAKVDESLIDEEDGRDEDDLGSEDVREDGTRGMRSRGNSSTEEPSLANAIEKCIETTTCRKSKRVVSNIIKRSIKCLNKIHAMDVVVGGVGGKVSEKSRNVEKVEEKYRLEEKMKKSEDQVKTEKKPVEVDSASRSLVRNHHGNRPHRNHQHQQNGGGTTEQAAVASRQSYGVKKEPASEPDTDPDQDAETVSELRKIANRSVPTERERKKRRSTEDVQNSNGNAKRVCLEQREEMISSLVGNEKISAEELSIRSDQLRAELQALDQLARTKEKEWNEILSLRKLKEEAFLRVERRRQVVGFMEGSNQLGESCLTPATLSLDQEWENAKEKSASTEATLSDKSSGHQIAMEQGENGQKEIDAQTAEQKQISEGRQGPMVDVRTIIADYRLRHPESIPRRSRRMRNSVNVALGTGGGIVETSHTGGDSRPSSTDSCKSGSNAADPNNSMSFKDVLVQFAKLSQQQGEAVKTPQNYPDVTLHPVMPTPTAQVTTVQPSGSLLHGILTKSQSPRPTTFSPTLARLLTAPERERCNPVATSTPHQNAAAQQLLQAYQGANPVSITDLLSSSKARTEITITPVVNTPTPPSHSNNLIHVEDVEDDTTSIDDRGRSTSAREDSPPRCQGCQERAAQFVCAGCGNQWYCSRECQVSAWDEHSEVCSG